MGGEKMMPNFAQALLDEVMPQVEKQYRVTKDRQERAIAGLSMGGAEALFTGLNHQDNSHGLRHSAGLSLCGRGGFGGRNAPPPAGGGRGAPSVDSSVFEKNFPSLIRKRTNSSDSCDRLRHADGLNGVNQQFKAWLKSKDIQFTDVETPGMAHVWPLWRQNLTEIAPMLFQAKAK